MNDYYGNNDWRDYLAHYGVKGMKWRHHKYKSEQGYLGEGGINSQLVAGKNGRFYYNHPIVKKTKRNVNKWGRSEGAYQLSAAKWLANKRKVRTDVANANSPYMKKEGKKTRDYVYKNRREASEFSDKERMYKDSYYNRKTLGGAAERAVSRGKGTLKKYKVKGKKALKKLNSLKDKAVYSYNFRKGVRAVKRRK